MGRNKHVDRSNTGAITGPGGPGRRRPSSSSSSWRPRQRGGGGQARPLLRQPGGPLTSVQSPRWRDHGMTMIDFISLSSNYFSLRHALSKRYCFTENNYLNSDNL